MLSTRVVRSHESESKLFLSSHCTSNWCWSRETWCSVLASQSSRTCALLLPAIAKTVPLRHVYKNDIYKKAFWHDTKIMYGNSRLGAYFTRFIHLIWFAMSSLATKNKEGKNANRSFAVKTVTERTFCARVQVRNCGVWLCVPQMCKPVPENSGALSVPTSADCEQYSHIEAFRTHSRPWPQMKLWF